MVTMMFLLALIYGFSLIAIATADDDLRMCCLCEGCYPPANGNVYTNSYRQTCNDLALDMADDINDSKWRSNKCYRLQQQHRDRCCNANSNAGLIEQAPVPSPADAYEEGDNPVCTLCHDGRFPKKRYTITASLAFDGNPTCEDLYYWGLKGRISEQICKPLQDHMDEPCGCGHASGEPAEPPPPTPWGGGGGGSGGGSGPIRGVIQTTTPGTWVAIALWFILITCIALMVRRKINEIKESG